MVNKEGQTLSAIDAKFRVKNIIKELSASDAIMIRALEDLILVLLDKNVIDLEEINPTIVEKLKHRKKLRAEMNKIQNWLDKKY